MLLLKKKDTGRGFSHAKLLEFILPSFESSKCNLFRLCPTCQKRKKTKQ